MSSELKLSERLQVIFNSLLPNQPVWDFCCDHGYLGLVSYHSRRFPAVYFLDQVAEIIDALKIKFHDSYFHHQNPTQVYWVNARGEDLKELVSGNLVIAGVGAKSIMEIIGALSDRQLLDCTRVIIAPQNHPIPLETALNDRLMGRYRLTERHVVFEKSRQRFILIYDRAE